MTAVCDWFANLFSAIYNIPDGFAVLITGVFAVVAAFVALYGIRMQIAAADKIELARKRDERHALEVGMTAELLAFSSAIIQATSAFNQRARLNPNVEIESVPRLPSDRVFNAFLPKIGLISEGWPIGAMVTFYAHVSELNEIALERANLRGPQTEDQTNVRVAERFRLMANNLAQAIEGLNPNRGFPNPPEVDLQRLHAPDGAALARDELPPRTIQETLKRLAGHPPRVNPPAEA